MRGLLKKDLKSLAQQSRVVALLLVFYGALFILGGQKNSGMFMGMIGMLSVLLPITALSYDENVHWDRYALTMPISRNMLVWSKYLLSILISLGCALLSLAVYLLTNTYPLRETLLLSWMMVGVALCLSAVAYPLFFKLGVEKARYAFMAIFLVPSMLILLLSSLNIALPALDGERIEAFLPFLPLGALALFGASALLSCRIYAKKEF